jgi:hypothetical protein
MLDSKFAFGPISCFLLLEEYIKRPLLSPHLTSPHLTDFAVGHQLEK